MKVLITGAAGFIGSHLMIALARRGDEVVGVDSLNDYYDPELKVARLRHAGIDVPATAAGVEWGREYTSADACCRFIRLAIDDKAALDRLFDNVHFDKVMNLAAQAGVRYSITHPYSYLKSNLEGFLNILEACRNHGLPDLVFASSSSVYGLNDRVPYSEDDNVDKPVSLYAATKKSNELMAHAYAKLYGLRCIGLRYFTVYGPYGRPDMSPILFADAISEGRPIKVFNNGDMIRDFTYIDDIIEGTVRCIDHELDAAKCANGVPFRVYNIGCSHPVRLMDFISTIETAMGREAVKEYLPMQPGDVYQTNADTTRLETELGYHPHWTLPDGIARFVAWYKAYYNR